MIHSRFFRVGVLKSMGVALYKSSISIHFNDEKMMCSMIFLPSSYWDLPLNLSLEAQGRVPGFRQHGMDQNEVMTTWDQPSTPWRRRHEGNQGWDHRTARVMEDTTLGRMFVHILNSVGGKKALTIVESLLRYCDCERGTKSNPKFRGLNPRPALANAGHASRTNPGLSNCVYTTCSNLCSSHYVQKHFSGWKHIFPRKNIRIHVG